LQKNGTLFKYLVKDLKNFEYIIVELNFRFTKYCNKHVHWNTENQITLIDKYKKILKSGNKGFLLVKNM